MTIRTEANLIRCIELAITNPAWDHLALQIGAKNSSTLFTWLSDSKAHAEQRREADSPYYLDAGELGGLEWWHDHMLRSRAASVLRMTGIIQDHVTNGVEETVFNPQTGLPQKKLSVLGEQHPDDAWYVENGIDPNEKYEWERDPLTGDIVAPIYLTKITQASAALKIKLLTGLVPKIFGERVEHNVAVKGAVVHHMQPPAFKSDSGQIEDAEFCEVREALPAPAERDDIQQLRRQAAELAARGPKNPTPTAPVDLGTPRDDGAAKPSSEYQGRAEARARSGRAEQAAAATRAAILRKADQCGRGAHIATRRQSQF